ncbi:MAG TPA: glutamyl-tRNA reductase [Actinomycetota bacterium]|nr:glutamyl-tRNA reductase [Actinomycetota bacterium]
MPILGLGVSYRRAPVELLERLAFANDDYPKAYRRLRELDAVREAVVLSTCNRVEVFGDVTSYHAGFLDLKRFLSESREIPSEEFADPLYSHYEDDAAEHLFAVAAGVDSMVLGEPQIFAQVREAYRRAESEGATGPVLAALFRGAVRAGRRVRAETGIGAAPSGFVQAGAGLAESELGELSGKAVAVVGAGAMATLAAKHLVERRVESITVLSRNPDRAAALAAKVHGTALPLTEIPTAVSAVDLVVSSTGASGTVIGIEAVREALRARRSDRPLFVLDLAVPRDVEPEVGHLPGVRLADLDDLRDAVSARNAGAADEVARAREIIGEEVHRFTSWRRSAKLSPLIQALREHGASIEAAELARVAPKLADLSPKQREAVESLAQGIVAKLLHQPIVTIKQRAGSGPGESLAQTVAELFGLDVPESR